MNDLSHIFEPSACLSEEMIIAYVKNELTPEQKHQAEKHFSDCPLCAAEAEGLAAMSDPNKLPMYVERINKKVDARIRPRRIIPFSRIKPAISIAAAIVVLLGIGFIIRYTVFNASESYDMAEQIFEEMPAENPVETAKETDYATDSTLKDETESEKQAEEPVIEETQVHTPNQQNNTHLTNRTEVFFDDKETTEPADDVTIESIETDSDDKSTEYSLEEESNEAETNTDIGNSEDRVTARDIQDKIKTEKQSEDLHEETAEEAVIAESSERKKENSFFGTTRSSGIFSKKSQPTVAEDSNVISTDIEKQYEMAVQAFEKQDTQKAVSLFDEIIELKDKHLYDALWYRGLLYEQSDKAQKAKECFKQVAESNTKYSKAAREKLH